MLAVIKHNLEAPISGQGHRCVRSEIWKIRSTVAIENVLEVPLGGTRRIAAVALVCLGEINPRRVLRLILIDDNVALVVIALADQPTGRN